MHGIHGSEWCRRSAFAGWLAVSLLLVAGVARGDPREFTLGGPGSTGYFGWSVSSTGDLNGDGFPDVVVGAWGCDTGGTDAGAVSVFLGGPDADEVADLVLHGAAAGDHFGWSVAVADVNGDGYDDVLAGAEGNDAGGSGAGAVFVYYGGASLDGTPDLALLGSGGCFGCAVAGLGDVNHDGYGDIGVGALTAETGGLSTGAAYVFFGGASPDATPDLTLASATEENYFGSNIAGVSDVNGDGYDDFAISAPGHDAVYGDDGVVFVYLGGAPPNTVADLALVARGGDAIAGSDLDQDGFSDIVVGAPWDGTAGVAAGAVFVFRGSASPDTTTDLKLLGATAGEHFGSSVATGSDLNGNGRPDLAVGAPYADVGGTDAGAAYAYDGDELFHGVPLVAVRGEAAGDRVGWSVGTVTGFGADCRAGLVVGSRLDGSGGPYDGRVRVYGSFTPPAAYADAPGIGGQAAYNFLGYFVAGGGDVNGDGYDDVVVGAYGWSSNRGAAYVRFGGPDAPSDLRLSGQAAAERFGSSVAMGGDVNGDEFADVVVGAHQNDQDGTDAGRAYIFFGSASPDTVPDLVLHGPVAMGHFGERVAVAGDVNGDGYGDVVVGAYPSGRAYVFFGGAMMDAVPDMVLQGDAYSVTFGAAVAGAGDVNADGYDDIVVGDPSWSMGESSVGAVFVYFGGASPDTTADWKMGGGADQHLGTSVDGAGDVNGDGFDDVVVGGVSGWGETDTGHVAIFHGGTCPDGWADWEAWAAGPLGCSVAGVGDVNGDGYDDVVAGLPLGDYGKAVVYYGGWIAAETAEWTLPGAPSVTDYFGYSVAGAGDMSGDGVPDIVVGAFGTAFAAYFSGYAYVYDWDRYAITTPNGGETWTAGTKRLVRWRGAEPADLWYSADGGASYEPLAAGVGGADENYSEVTVPATPSTRALVRATPHRATLVSGFDVSDAFFTIYDPSAGVEGRGAGVLRLSAPWPNPASSAVRLVLNLPTESVVTLRVYDVAGREVARPVAGETLGAGTVTREWQPGGLAPGVYTVRALVGSVRLTQRLVWLGGR